MTNVIDKHRSEVAALCQRAGARRLDAFGSVLRDDFDPQTSDLDFFVEFDEVSPAEYAQEAQKYSTTKARVPRIGRMAAIRLAMAGNYRRQLGAIPQLSRWRSFLSGWPAIPWRGPWPWQRAVGPFSSATH